MSNMNLSSQSIVLSQTDIRHRHLCDLPLQEYREAKPTIRIGLDDSELGVANRTRTSDCGGPIAAKTPLGWVVYGRQAAGTISTYVMHCCEDNERYDRMEQIVRDYHTTDSFGVKTPTGDFESDADIRARLLLNYDGVHGRSLPDRLAMASRQCTTTRVPADGDAAFRDSRAQDAP